MRFLFILTRGVRGGPATHLLQLADALQARGHAVALLAGPGPLHDEYRQRGGTTFVATSFRNTYNPLAVAAGMREVRTAVATFTPDLVSCHTVLAGVYGRLALRGRIPTLFTAHNWSFAPGSPLVRRIIAPLVEAVLAPYAARIICVSEYNRQQALRLHLTTAARLVTIHNGVELLSQASYRTDTDAPVTVTMVGRFEEPKQQALLAAAVAALPSAVRERVRLQYVGDGPLRSRTEAAVRSYDLTVQTTFCGDRSRDAVIDLLRDSDIAVLATRWEGFPRSLLEAMSVGLPIIASRVGAVDELVVPSCGMLVPPGDRAALTAALAALVQDPARRRAYGEAGRARVCDSFSSARMCRETFAVYEAVLRRSV